MSSRDPSFDILKGTGIILVFVAHTFVKDISPFILSFHMPLFFIVSGYFFKPRPLAGQLQADFRRIFVPLLLICAVSVLLTVLQDACAGHAVAHPDSPAWFLSALFCAKFLYACVSKAFPHHALLVSFIVSSIPCLGLHWFSIPRNAVIFSSCFCAVVFIALGHYVRCNHLLTFLHRHIHASAAVALLLWLNTSIFGKVDLHLCIFKLWVVDFAGACGGTYLCYVLSRQLAATVGRRGSRTASKPTSWLAKLGYYSFVVYSFHAIEYVFPSWFQLCALLGCSSLPAILLIRFSLCCAASWTAMQIAPVRQIFFPITKKNNS